MNHIDTFISLAFQSCHTPRPSGHRGMMPFAAVKLAVGRRFHIATDPQERPEGVEWLETPVKAECVLVQIGLKMLRADTVMASAQPRFQVAENEMHAFEYGVEARMWSDVDDSKGIITTEDFSCPNFLPKTMP